MSERAEVAVERRVGNTEINMEIHELRADIQELRESVDGLLKAWTAAKGFITVIKILAGVAAGAASMWVVIREVVNK